MFKLIHTQGEEHTVSATIRCGKCNNEFTKIINIDISITYPNRLLDEHPSEEQYIMVGGSVHPIHCPVCGFGR